MGKTHCKGENIRKSTLEDLSAMLALFEQARGIMRSDGNSYIVERNGKPVATFAFILEEDPTYRVIEGQWLNDGPYGTIHRLASGPESHGIVEGCFNYCWNRIHNLRIDTHSDNHIMQHCIDKFGFKKCGVIHIANGEPRLVYQEI